MRGFSSYAYRGAAILELPGQARGHQGARASAVHENAVIGKAFRQFLVTLDSAAFDPVEATMRGFS